MSRVIVGEADLTLATFKDPLTGEPTDPATVAGIVKKPDGSITSAPITITKQSVGVYLVETDTDTAGIWYLTVTGDDEKFEKTICVIRSSTT